jgi:imidazolonepropionase-like amidohydrolase
MFEKMNQLCNDPDLSLKTISSFPAFLARSNKYLGTLEIGKYANLVITNVPLTNQDEADNYPIYTFLRGKKVYAIQ